MVGGNLYFLLGKVVRDLTGIPEKHTAPALFWQLELQLPPPTVAAVPRQEL